MSADPPGGFSACAVGHSRAGPSPSTSTSWSLYAVQSCLRTSQDGHTADAGCMLPFLEPVLEVSMRPEIEKIHSAYERSVVEGDRLVDQYLQSMVASKVSAAREEGKVVTESTIQRLNARTEEPRRKTREIGRTVNRRANKPKTDASEPRTSGSPSPRRRGRTSSSILFRLANQQPPGPPLSQGPPTRVDADGNRWVKPFGASEYRPETVVGFQKRDTNPAGLPALPPTIGPRVPARESPVGPESTGPDGRPLYHPRMPGPSGS